jgi:hypothetical protein
MFDWKGGQATVTSGSVTAITVGNDRMVTDDRLTGRRAERKSVTHKKLRRLPYAK